MEKVHGQRPTLQPGKQQKPTVGTTGPFDLMIGQVYQEKGALREPLAAQRAAILAGRRRKSAHSAAEFLQAPLGCQRIQIAMHRHQRDGQPPGKLLDREGLLFLKILEDFFSPLLRGEHVIC